MCKENIVNYARKAKIKAQNAAMMLSATATVGMAQLGTVAFADGDAKSLMETVIKIIATLVFIPAAIMSVTGVIQYASAHSDGDGPAQKKAINMLSAGIMLAALGIILRSTASTFSGLISTSI